MAILWNEECEMCKNKLLKQRCDSQYVCELNINDCIFCHKRKLTEAHKTYQKKNQSNQDFCYDRWRDGFQYIRSPKYFIVS